MREEAGAEIGLGAEEEKREEERGEERREEKRGERRKGERGKGVPPQRIYYIVKDLCGSLPHPSTSTISPSASLPPSFAGVMKGIHLVTHPKH